MAKPTVETKTAKYRAARKQLTKLGPKSTAADRKAAEDKLAGAENELLAQVGLLIGKTVAAR